MRLKNACGVIFMHHSTASYYPSILSWKRYCRKWIMPTPVITSSRSPWVHVQSFDLLSMWLADCCGSAHGVGKAVMISSVLADTRLWLRRHALTPLKVASTMYTAFFLMQSGANLDRSTKSWKEGQQNTGKKDWQGCPSIMTETYCQKNQSWPPCIAKAHWSTHS